jgi:hypothetical protein
MEDLGMKMPKPVVDLNVIRREYHEHLEEAHAKKKATPKKGTDGRNT